MKLIKGIIKTVIVIVLFVVLVAGGIAGGAYIIVTKAGMVGTIADKLDDKVPQIQLSDEAKAQNLLEYGKSIYAKLQNINTATIGEIEQTIGYTALSQAIANFLGIDIEIVRNSTIPGLGDAIVDSLRVRTLSENFGVEYPDFPLFKDEVFLNSPLTEAFSDLGDHNVDKFIKVTYDGNSDGETPSSKIMQKLGVLKMTDLSAQMDSVIADTTIGELIEVDSASEPILRALRDVKLNANDLNDAVGTLKVKDVFENYDTGVLSLLNPETPLKEVANTLSSTIANANLYRLINLGVYTLTNEPTSPEAKSKLYNNNPNGVLDEYTLILAHPENAAAILAPTVFSGVSGVIDQDLLDLLGVKNGDILSLSGGATIPADTVFTTVFNLNTNEYTLDIGDNVTVDSFGGYMYLRGDLTGGPITSVQTIKKSATETIPAVYVQAIDTSV